MASPSAARYIARLFLNDLQKCKALSLIYLTVISLIGYNMLAPIERLSKGGASAVLIFPFSHPKFLLSGKRKSQ
jgi:hypothetical protein